jgi:hypothetical protein
METVKLCNIIRQHTFGARQSRWLRGLRSGSAAVCLLGLRVRIQSVARLSVSCEYFMLSGRGFYVGLITRPEESYEVWCVQLQIIAKSR